MVITGLIRPPPEIRAVADKTAQFVAKNGRAFEDRIINSAKGKTPKFAFLDPKSPFHAYYEDKIQFYEQGGEDGDDKDESSKAAETKKAETTKQQQKENAKNGGAIRKKEKSIKASAQDPVAVALLTQRNKIAQAREAATSSTTSSNDEAVPDEASAEISRQPTTQTTIEPPPPIQYITILAPSNLTPAQIETMQLVAQFAALDGKNGPFLQMLAMQEWHNPIFGFLQPRHGHFAYFCALVDAYRRILGLWTNSAQVSGAGFDRLVDKMANNVNACLEMASYRAEYDRDVGHREKEHNEEASLAAQVDWHDFVVVETIDFPASEIVLPPPPPPPPKFVVPKAVPNKPIATVPVQEAKDESDDDDEEGENIRVVPTYTPKVVSTGALVKDRTHVLDPITGKSVPVADMPEHMRIQLLDPKWAEERRKFQEKQKDSNFVSGDVIANNLSRLAQARGVGKSDDDSKTKGRDAKRDQAEAQSDAGQSNISGLPYPPPGMEPQAKRPRLDESQLPTGTSFVPAPTAIGGLPPPNPASTFPVPTLSPPVPPPLTTAAAPSTVGPSEIESSESQLLPEAEFVATLSKPDVTLQIRVPNDPSQMAWNFYGQIVSLSVNVMSKVKEVKEQLSTTHLNSMPANKIQLKSVQAGAFLKDSLSLAQLNIGPTATLELVPKIRGGRK